MQYAGFWIRFWATVVDSFVWLPLGVLIYLKLALDAVLLGEGSSLGFLYFIVSVVGPWLYSSLFESSKWQATPGKRLLGVYVTDLNGGKISFGRASARYFSKSISYLILGVGFFIAGITHNKQALHDKIASTLVYKGKAEESDGLDMPVRSNAAKPIGSLNSNWVLAGFGADGDLVRITFSSDDEKLASTGLVVGRSFDNCDLYIKDGSVSRRHARFYSVNRKIYIEDLDSKNGVSINGRPINKNSSVELPSHGDLTIGGVELTIGKY